MGWRKENEHKMTVQAAIRTTDDRRYRIWSLSDDLPVSAQGDSREEAIRNFRAEADKAMRQSVEIITLEIPEPALDKELTIADSPEWQAAKGILADDDDYAAFMEGVHRRRRELDELEEQWQTSSS
jgi:hypothetical protein